MHTDVEKEPVRVLHIVGDSRYGGIARIILGLGRIAKSNGWQVDVLATDATVQHVLRQADLGVINLDVIHREIRPLRDLAGLLRLHRFLRRERYTLVHTHTSKAGFIGRLAAWLAGVPAIVHTVHGFAFHEQSPATVRMFYTRLERMAARWCDRIVSVSQFHRGWALELGICGPAQIEAIPNGITPQARKVTLERGTLRRNLGVGDQELFILSVARLAPDKGLANLIEAAAILRPGERKFHVVIAGDGPGRAQLERLVRKLGLSDLVTFLGFRQDVDQLLTAADLVVLPSLREGLSISLLEAMAAAKPIIATSIGSHRELVSQGEIARLVPPADPKTLAVAILQLASDPARMASLGASARALFESRYTEERMLNEYRRVYRDLVEKKSTIASAVAVGREPVIRSATTHDLTSIVRIHQSAFRRFFVTQLGGWVLRLYYRLVMNYHAGVILVSEDHGALTGFVCGFLDPGDFYRLMWANRRSFALPALAALFRHPSLAGNVIRAIRRIQTSAVQGPPARSCELSSIAVAPEACGNGLGKTLLRAFLQRSWSMDAQSVFLTTDADGNERANAMYREVGFECTRRFMQRRGRWMNEYVLRQAPSAATTEESRND
jgi:glycosyltransferase involved in cell wall biosynthesis/ribosomal protein S18 acetylase RimI-like enzyme